MTGKDGGLPETPAQSAPETMSPPTLETVAAEAGVSRATVSRVVNGSPRVSDEVRTTVEAAVARLGYVPNRAARSLVTRRTGSVALVVSEAEMKVFTDPLTFNVTRQPNDHLSFGAAGPHYCLGAHLARREMIVTFHELFKQLPDIEVSGPPQWLMSNFLNGIKHLPVEFTPTGGAHR